MHTTCKEYKYELTPEENSGSITKYHWINTARHTLQSVSKTDCSHG